MKNKKYILIITIVLLSFFITQKTFALKRAFFPNEKLLQPIQIDVHPSTSGRLNTSEKTVDETSNTTNNPINTNTSTTTQDILSKNIQTNTTNTTNYIVLIIITSLLIFFIFIIYKQYKKK